MGTKKRLSWEEYAMRLAFTASERSEDPYVKVGACGLRKNRSVCSLGYNGSPPGIEINWNERDERRKRVLHAEINMLRYTKVGECDLVAVTMCPCGECVKSLAAYGVKKIVFRHLYDKDTFGLTLAKEFGICIEQLYE